ncbi:MAG: VOC family protein [Acidobacteria bacterium]|nr:VOC family protein [Acidobacteriota bacterium]
MPRPRPKMTGVLETVLYFSDEEKTQRFYSEVLGFRLVGREPGRSLFYRAGKSVFLLFQAEETLKGNSLPSHGASGAIHTCFVVPADEYENWKSYLAENGVPVIHQLEWPLGLSFYFHDPDRNLLEIANNDLWPA